MIELYKTHMIISSTNVKNGEGQAKVFLDQSAHTLNIRNLIIQFHMENLCLIMMQFLIKKKMAI